MCRGGGRQATDEFRFEDVELECVGEFAYLCNMLNDTGGVEENVAAMVKAAWMNFKRLGVILCMQLGSLRMKGVVYKACSQRVGVWG